MKTRILALVLLAGWLGPGLPALAEPALSEDIIADLQRLEAQLREGALTQVVEQADAQAARLRGGNRADRWSRALYLQLAALADARTGQATRAAERMQQTRGIEPAPAAWRLARLKEEATLRHVAGQKGQAVTLLQAWFERGGDDEDSRWRLIRWLAELERFEEAAEQLQAVGDVGGMSPEQRALAVSLHQRTGREQEALALLAAGLDAEAPAEAWRRAAALARHAGKAGRAAALWESGWRLGVLSGENALLQRARLHLAGGTPARAADYLEAGLQGGTLSDSAATRRLLAQAHEVARMREPALAAWQAVAERENQGEDWLHLGRLALAWGEEALAIRAFEAASRQGVADAEAWLARMQDTSRGQEAPPQAPAED